MFTVNVKSILTSLGIQFKQVGNELRARCPSGNHPDETPSWNQNITYPYFHHCFSCDFKGTIETLVKKMTGKTLYEFLNIEDPRSFDFVSSLKNQNQNNSSINRKTRLNMKKGRLYSPLENKTVMSYLKSRHINKPFINDFEITYCEYIEINKTKFKNRIMIPIVENEIIVSYEGRDYLKTQTPKVLYPNKSFVSTFFNIDNLNDQKELIIVEGIMDIPQIYTHITKNVTTIFGVNISKGQLELLKNFKDKSIILLFDNDKAGREAISKIDDFIDYEYKIAFLNEGQDPGSASLQEIENALKNAKVAGNYFWDRAEQTSTKKEQILSRNDHEW
jgi:5S rRNA maturation endonuclease (ribonuclease M5)